MADPSPTRLRQAIDISLLHTKANQIGNRSYSPFALPDASFPKDRNFDALSFYDEAKLANDFAFISANGVTPGDVTAAAVEAFKNGADMTVKISANESISEEVKKRLQSIIMVLRRVSRKGAIEGDLDSIIANILAINMNKLYFRLGCHLYKRQPGYTARQLPVMLSQALERDFQRPEMKAFSLQSPSTMEKLARLYNILAQLQSMSVPEDGMSLLKDAVRLSFRILRIESYSSRRRAVDLFNLMNISSIYRLSQIARYIQVAQNLLYYAKRYQTTIRGINIKFLEPHPLINKRRVHAEVQLLLHYEQSVDGRWPRAIGSSKAACYLCRKLIEFHGSFVILHSHGRFYPAWTLPNTSLTKRGSLRRVIKASNALISHLDGLHRQLGFSPKLEQPRESVVSLTEIAFRGPSTVTFQPLDTRSQSSVLSILSTDLKPPNHKRTMFSSRSRDIAIYIDREVQTTLVQTRKESTSQGVQAEMPVLPAIKQTKEDYHSNSWLNLIHSRPISLRSEDETQKTGLDIQLEPIGSADMNQQSRIMDISNLQPNQSLSMALECLESDYFIIKSHGRYMRVWLKSQ